MSNDRHGPEAKRPTPTARRNDRIALLYRHHAAQLRRMVASRVKAPRAVIEDACQTAWMRLCARIDVDAEAPTVVGWLLTTAVRESWRQAGAQQTLSDGFRSTPEGDVPAEPVADTAGPLELALEHEHSRELRARLKALNAREQRFLGLQALGLSYQEIAQLTNTSVRTVERQIYRGRRKLNHAGNRPARSIRRQGGEYRPPRALPLIELQPINYRGRLVALAGARRCIFSDELERRPPGDPERTFVLYMCLYAADVLSGVLPRPYTDARAPTLRAGGADPRRAAAAALPEPRTDLARTRDPALRARRALTAPGAASHAAPDAIAGCGFGEQEV
jgi:RNA polymerase sigma factor (sigma-70 family)